MNSPIDRDFARMQHELRAASQDWHNPAAPMPKRSLVYRLTHRQH
ncbi:MAG: hypothetical protein U0Q21_14460 [Dermatophilaceae bacterium]